tara:strand:- start:40 stop:1479 length:1440 start_codon:yes stop_codon:yes gene_type:complete
MMNNMMKNNSSDATSTIATASVKSSAKTLDCVQLSRQGNLDPRNWVVPLSLFGFGIYHLYNILKASSKQEMIIMNDWPFHDEILKYICHKYGEEINSFNYSIEKMFHFNEYRYRHNERGIDYKVLQPNECAITIIHNGNEIDITFEIIRDNNGDIVKQLISNGCISSEEIMTKLVMRSISKDSLTDFSDDALKWCEEENKRFKACNKGTMNLFYWKKDYWDLISKSPKRPLSTVYLKEGYKEEIVDNINKFFNHDTRDIYLSFGIPYKSVQLIHGPPGTGKTSLIKSIASQLNCDLYILPISKDMLDTNLVDALSYISQKDEKERIIVIEDIDTIFDSNRKKDDNSNGITLQAFLNCLDGFTCVEGTMLFLTANKPEVLDYAMVRSCRIDNKIKLDYANEYQTRNMFTTFLPDQVSKFKDFYDEIKYRDYTTAMLQEFLFYNRDCDDIMKIIDKFIDIFEKNDPKNFELIKEEQKNFYS